MNYSTTIISKLKGTVAPIRAWLKGIWWVRIFGEETPQTPRTELIGYGQVYCILEINFIRVEPEKASGNVEVAVLNKNELQSGKILPYIDDERRIYREKLRGKGKEWKCNASRGLVD